MNLKEQNVIGAEPTATAPSPVETSVPFSVDAVPFHQAAIWLAEVGVGAGITSSRYPFEEMMELVMIARDLGSAMTMGFIGGDGARRLVNEMRLPPVSKELHEICKNSMECHLQEMRRLVKEEKAKFGGSDKVEVFPIATYPNHVVVFNTNREVFRATVDRSGARPFITKVEKLDLQPIRDWLDEGLSSLDASIECLFEGKKSDAKKKITEVISQFGGSDGLLRAKYRVIAKQLGAENFWKTYMAENKAMIRKYLHGELGKLRENNHRPRYSVLYTTHAPEIRVGVAEKLIAELNDLGNKADHVLNRINEAVKAADSLLDDSAFRTVDDEVQIGKFKRFAADYIEDLQGLRSAIQEALRDKDVPAMALVYDTAAGKFEEYKIAGRLIEKILETMRSKAAK